MAYNALRVLQSSRYTVECKRAPKSSDWINNVMPFESDRRFERFFRVTRETFGHLLALIENDLVFYNNSTCPQAPVQTQLLVFLYYLGASSDAGSWMHLGKVFGIDEGTVGLYVTRVMTAILNRENDIVRWPEPGTEFYKSTIERHLADHGFPSCLGFVDGCHIALIRRPFHPKHKAYYTRKDQYAINMTLVVDSDTRILMQHIGQVGSAHDSAVFRLTSLYEYPEAYFHDRSAYIIGDSAYRLTNWLVKPFNKSQLAYDRSGEHRSFNKQLSSARVNVEHCFGIMKARFPILRRIPLIVNEIGGHDRVVDVIRSTCVLHNFLLDCDDEWELDAEDRAIIDRDMERSFRDYDNSEWAGIADGLDEQEWEDAETQKQLGEIKREHLVREVLRNEAERDLVWWRGLGRQR